MTTPTESQLVLCWKGWKRSPTVVLAPHGGEKQNTFLSKTSKNACPDLC